MVELSKYLTNKTGVTFNHEELEEVKKLSNKKHNLQKTELTVQEKYDIDHDFALVVIEWMEYKKERKQTYKSERAIKAFVTRLKKLSGCDPIKAKEIIDLSMSNYWAGIFELKEENGKKQGNRISDDFKQSLLDDLQNGISSGDL